MSKNSSLLDFLEMIDLPVFSADNGRTLRIIPLNYPKNEKNFVFDQLDMGRTRRRTSPWARGSRKAGLQLGWILANRRLATTKIKNAGTCASGSSGDDTGIRYTAQTRHS